MGDGRILERTAVFIDTLSAACRLPVQGKQTETAGIHTKILKYNQQSGQLICKNGLAAFFLQKMEVLQRQQRRKSSISEYILTVIRTQKKCLQR